MKRFLLIGALLVAVGLLVSDVHGGGKKTKGKGKIGETVEKPEPKLNAPPEGFSLLFNGKDLSGWQGALNPRQKARLKGAELEAAQRAANQRILPHWRVENGVLVHDGKGGNLQTVKEFGDFELLVDWKIMKGGDSGIYLRGHPQVQIWHRKEGSGGLYNNKKEGRNPKVNADYPPGHWNTFRIIMKGDNVTVFLNGVRVVNNVPMENYWDRGQPFPETGPIELQHHGDQLWFRNIYIKELD